MSSAKKPVVGNRLPEDLMIEVLLRIPSRKCLLRFRCVSKGLRNLIDSRLFKNRWEVFHYSVSDDFTIMFTDNADANGRLFSIDFHSPDNLNSGEETQVLFPENLINHSFIGCCRGLVCFGVYSDSDYGAPNRYILFNPSNGTIQNCRDLNVDELRGQFFYKPNNFALGCGFDNSKQNEDFKIVRFQVQYGVSSAVDVFRRVDVYSLRRDSWRQIDVEEFGVGHPIVIGDGRNGICIEGAIHWMWRPGREYKIKPSYIVAFDLQSESSKRMMLPAQLVVEEKDQYIGLNDFGGRLCVCVDCFSSGTTTVWVMEEYGVDTSWSQLFSIVIPYPHPNGFLGYFPRQDGARLLIFTRDLGPWFWYNTQDGSKENIQIHKLSSVQTYIFPDRYLSKSWICVGRSPLRLPYSDM